MSQTDSSTTKSQDAASQKLKALLVMGNWKMNGSLAANAKLLADLRTGLAEGLAEASAHFAVCVPAPYLAQVAEALKATEITWGAQDVSARDAGAYTGEVSAAMLKDFACTWVLVGHSERRSMHAEGDELVAEKAKAALIRGVTPVVCVGESLAERDAGQVHEVIAKQLAPVIALGAESLRQMVVAYEPVWAIGTGRTATPEQAQEVHAGIRQALSAAGAPDVKVLYGGSVKSSNAASLFAMPDIDGALVGGASLMADEFLRIGA
jgi:triosephosphate isomerase